MTHEKQQRPGGGTQALQDVLDDSLIVAQDDNSFWHDAAEAAIRQLAATGRIFDSEDVRALVPGEPPHQNVPGLVFAAMHRAGVTEPVGFAVSRRKSVAGAAVRLWRGTLAFREGRLRGDAA